VEKISKTNLLKFAVFAIVDICHVVIVLIKFQILVVVNVLVFQ